MTAPTQPPDPRVSKVADAVKEWKYAKVSHESDKQLARVLVEELGGREVETPRAWVEDAWNTVAQAIQAIDKDAFDPSGKRGEVAANWINRIAASLAGCQSQQRENAETIQALRERVETAEAANTELDNARKSAEQSARDLRAENARLRAKLDAMTVEQVPVAYDVKGWGIFRNSDPDVLEREWWKARQVIAGPFKPKPLYEHPSPAARVVGEMLVVQKGEMRTVSSTWNDEMLTTPPDVGTYALSITPNADGQTARVDEVSDTANGLRYVARGPNSPQGAVAYGRTAKDATQLLDTIRQHQSTPNADGAK